MDAEKACQCRKFLLNLFVHRVRDIAIGKMPGGAGSQFHGNDLFALVIWTAVGLFIAVRRFRWEP